jgi:hypothetical protein
MTAELLVTPLNTNITIHRHKWTVIIDEHWLTEYPCDCVQDVVAVCVCGMRLTKAEIEQVLDDSGG